jgi:hypothetical protein
VSIRFSSSSVSPSPRLSVSKSPRLLAEVRPDRVAWIETRNLPTNNLHAAARIMAATARDSDSVQPPLYHFTISFDPHDPVDDREGA